MRSQGLQSGRQRCFAGNAQVRRGPCHSDVNEAAIEIWDATYQPINTDKKHSSELEALDVLDVEDTHLMLVADDLAFLAAGDGNTPLGQ
jgi:hypothetical protein